MLGIKRCLSLPIDSPEHRRIRDEIWIAGTDGECRYYLSMLLAEDVSELSSTEFLQSLRQFLSTHVNPMAIQFCHEPEFGHVSIVVLSVLKAMFYEREHLDMPEKPSKEERALVLLLRNPSMTDEEIRRSLATTDKQICRWSRYQLARRIQRFYLESLSDD